MAYEANLYKRTPQTLGAPKLEPKSSVNQNGNGIPGLVDVHRTYRWTLSQPVAREIVPMLQLTEYKLVLSSEVSGFLYTLRGEVDNLNVLIQEIGPNVQRTGAALQSTGGAIASELNSLLGNVEKGVTKAADANKEILDKAAQQDLVSGADEQSGLKPYTGLYALDPTGWTYNLPYLGPANMASPNNQWGESSVIAEGLKKAGGGILNFFGGLPSSKSGPGAAGAAGAKGDVGGGDIGKVFGGLKDFYSGATAAALSLGGGLVSKETPQSFTGTDSDKIDVSFYLLNTHDVKDIRRNWEFCYLLTYQNLANRKGINLLDPPCMYSATIAGYKQLPICWVTGFQVTNVGTTRLIDITTGEISPLGAVSPYIKMIPEAYRVSFTLQSSLKNARNIFQFVEDPSYKVSITGV
jgi:hypothetical protein